MTESHCLELLPEAALRVDPRGADVEANRLAPALFGPPPAPTGVNGFLQWLAGDGRRDQEFTHPDDRQSDVDADWRILRGEIDTWQCEKRFLRPDGSLVWALANATFLRDEASNPISWMGQFQDVSERKHKEKRLEETLSLLAATLDATADWRLPSAVLESGDSAALACVLDQLADPSASAADRRPGLELQGRHRAPPPRSRRGDGAGAGPGGVPAEVGLRRHREPGDPHADERRARTGRDAARQ